MRESPATGHTRAALWRGAALLFLLLAGAYTFSIGLRATWMASITGDEPFYLITTQSILQDGDLDLREQYERRSYTSFFDHPNGLWTQSVPNERGEILSPHDPGLSLLVLPGFVLGGLRGVQIELLLLAALTFSLAFLLAALETGALRLSWLCTAVAGLAAPGFVYATEVYPEMPAALCVVAGVLLLRWRTGGMARAVGLAALMSALAWLGLKYVPLGCVLAVAYLCRSGGRERLIFLGLSAVSGVAYLAWHLAVFGALTPYNDNLVYDGASTTSVVASHLALEERAYRIYGLFIDRRFGIGRWAPVFLAVLPGLLLLPRLKGTGWTVLGLIGTAILVAAFVAITMMGWWFPGRMLIAVFPLFPLVLVLVARRLPRVLALAAGVPAALYSLLVTALLVRAVAIDEVRVAVNPFAIQAWPFKAAGGVFPQYTAWGRDTVLLTALWLSLGAAVLLAWSWPRIKSYVKLRTRPARLPVMES